MIKNGQVIFQKRPEVLKELTRETVKAGCFVVAKLLNGKVKFLRSQKTVEIFRMVF